MTDSIDVGQVSDDRQALLAAAAARMPNARLVTITVGPPRLRLR